MPPTASQRSSESGHSFIEFFLLVCALFVLCAGGIRGLGYDVSGKMFFAATAIGSDTMDGGGTMEGGSDGFGGSEPGPSGGSAP